jgi:hypothetical protein
MLMVFTFLRLSHFTIKTKTFVNPEIIWKTRNIDQIRASLGRHFTIGSETGTPVAHFTSDLL